MAGIGHRPLTEARPVGAALPDTCTNASLCHERSLGAKHCEWQPPRPPGDFGTSVKGGRFKGGVRGTWRGSVTPESHCPGMSRGTLPRTLLRGRGEWPLEGGTLSPPPAPPFPLACLLFPALPGRGHL